jgi:hypothetical protein
MTKRFLVIFSVVFGLVQALSSFAQVSVKDSIVFAPLIDFTYSYNIPGGDLSQRFGNHSTIGMSFLIKTRKNFLYGVEWNYMFGDDVKDLSFADGFRDVNGGIMANNGLFSEIYFVERGFNVSGKIGQVLNLFRVNPNSGVMVMAGIGFIQHRIKFEDKYSEVPLLSGDNYYPGYDRLTNGVLFTEFIGYRLLSSRKLINVFAGFEFGQGLTKNRREINYDTGVMDNTSRMDLTAGFKLGFTLPLYKPTPQEYYYK